MRPTLSGTLRFRPRLRCSFDRKSLFSRLRSRLNFRHCRSSFLWAQWLDAIWLGFSKLTCAQCDAEFLFQRADHTGTEVGELSVGKRALRALISHADHQRFFSGQNLTAAK